MPSSQHLTSDGKATPEFADLMRRMADARPGARLGDVTILRYASLLGDVPMQALYPAVYRVLREVPGQFLPSVADIMRAVHGPAEDAGLVAWAGLRDAAGRVGAWASLEVEDPATAEALLLVFGSWPAFCEMEDGPALAIRRQEFMAAYRMARVKPRQAGQDARRLAGLCEGGGAYAGGPRVALGRLKAGGGAELVADRPAAPQLTEGDGR